MAVTEVNHDMYTFFGVNFYLPHPDFTVRSIAFDGDGRIFVTTAEVGNMVWGEHGDGMWVYEVGFGGSHKFVGVLVPKELRKKASESFTPIEDLRKITT